MTNGSTVLLKSFERYMRCLSAREFAHMPLISKRFPGGKFTAYYEMISLFQRPHCYRLTTNLIVQLVLLDKIKTKKWRLSEAVGNEDGAVLKAVKATDTKDASISTFEFLHFDSGIEMIKNRHMVFPTMILPEFDSSYATNVERGLAASARGCRNLGVEVIDYQSCEGWAIDVDHHVRDVQFWIDPITNDIKKLHAPVTLDSYPKTAQFASYVRSLGVKLNFEGLMSFNRQLPSDIFIDDTEFNAEMESQMFDPKNLQ